MKRAARSLSLSHSTAFRQLKKLEEDLGARLFERVGGNYELTEAGEVLLKHSRSIADGFDEIGRQVAGRDRALSGVVRVTAPGSFGYHFLPKYLSSFRAEHPQVRVELLVSNVEINLSTRQADIAIRVTSSPPDHLVGRKVRTIPWGVYAGASQSNLPRTLDELARQPLIGASGTISSYPAFAWQERYASENIVARCDDPVGMARCAEAGLGLAILPDDLGLPGLRRIMDFAPARQNAVWVLTHPDLRNVQRIRKLMTHLAEALSTDERLGADGGSVP